MGKDNDLVAKVAKRAEAYGPRSYETRDLYVSVENRNPPTPKQISQLTPVTKGLILETRA